MCIAGISLLQAEDFQSWTLSLEILGNTVYEVRKSLSTVVGSGSVCVIQDEKFALRFIFDNSYPITPPAVMFVVDDEYQAPVHPVRATF